jgi:hypothetical protein
VAELVSSRIQAELVQVGHNHEIAISHTQHMADITFALQFQVIGHTYLLYKPGNPPKIDLAALTAPQPPSQDKKKKE